MKNTSNNYNNQSTNMNKQSQQHARFRDLFKKGKEITYFDKEQYIYDNTKYAWIYIWFLKKIFRPFRYKVICFFIFFNTKIINEFHCKIYIYIILFLFIYFSYLDFNLYKTHEIFKPRVHHKDNEFSIFQYIINFQLNFDYEENLIKFQKYLKIYQEKHNSNILNFIEYIYSKLFEIIENDNFYNKKFKEFKFFIINYIQYFNLKLFYFRVIYFGYFLMELIKFFTIIINDFRTQVYDILIVELEDADLFDKILAYPIITTFLLLIYLTKLTILIIPFYLFWFWVLQIRLYMTFFPVLIALDYLFFHYINGLDAETFTVYFFEIMFLLIDKEIETVPHTLYSIDFVIRRKFFDSIFFFNFYIREYTNNIIHNAWFSVSDTIFLVICSFFFFIMPFIVPTPFVHPLFYVKAVNFRAYMKGTYFYVKNRTYMNPMELKSKEEDLYFYVNFILEPTLRAITPLFEEYIFFLKKSFKKKIKLFFRISKRFEFLKKIFRYFAGVLLWLKKKYIYLLLTNWLYYTDITECLTLKQREYYFKESHSCYLPKSMDVKIMHLFFKNIAAFYCMGGGLFFLFLIYCTYNTMGFALLNLGGLIPSLMKPSISAFPGLATFYEYNITIEKGPDTRPHYINKTSDISFNFEAYKNFMYRGFKFDFDIAHETDSFIHFIFLVFEQSYTFLLIFLYGRKYLFTKSIFLYFLPLKVLIFTSVSVILDIFGRLITAMPQNKNAPELRFCKLKVYQYYFNKVQLPRMSKTVDRYGSHDIKEYLKPDKIRFYIDTRFKKISYLDYVTSIETRLIDKDCVPRNPKKDFYFFFEMPLNQYSFYHECTNSKNAFYELIIDPETGDFYRDPITNEYIRFMYSDDLIKEHKSSIDVFTTLYINENINFFMNPMFFSILLSFINFIIILIPLLVSVAYLTLLERKVIGHMQRRTGPVTVGILGLLQPIADGVKLFLKETIVPSHSEKNIYILAPLITFSLSLLNWMVIPFGIVESIFNINLSVLFIFAISSLSVYGIILAGWSSNSKYAFLGAIRSSAQMISYEISISLILLTIFITNYSLNFIDIIKAQEFLWNCIIHFPMFFLFLISILAETNRHPFDLPEAEAELVSGYNVEYSAMTFALFFLGEYANIILMSTLTAIYFFGGWFFFINSFYILTLKILFFMFFFIWCRAAFPRYRYDQLMFLGWKILLPIAISWILITLGFLYFFDGLMIYNN